MNKAKVKVSRALAMVLADYAGDELPEQDKRAVWIDVHEQIGQRDYQDDSWKSITLLLDADQIDELMSWSDYEADMAPDYCDGAMEAGARIAMMRGFYNRLATAAGELSEGGK